MTRARRTRALATLVPAVLTLSLVSALPAPAGAATRPSLPALARMTPVAGSNATAAITPHAVTPASVAAPAVAWTGQHKVDLRKHPTRTWVSTGIPGAAVRKRSASAAGIVTVTALTAQQAAAHGATGATLQVTRSDGKPGAPSVDLRIDRATLTGLFGADFAARAQWTQLPAAHAAGTTVRPQHLAAARDAATGAVTIAPTLSSASVLVVAAGAPAAANGTGTWAATSLSPASAWQVSAQTGSFAWTYPLRVPPVSGPAPQLALSYDSGSVDGETGSTNNQPSAIGDGWNLSGAGFIERSYKACSTDGVASSGDLCWNTDNASISFAGHSGRLVPTGTAGQWRLQNDDGSRIEKLTGATNGDLGNSVDGIGEYWRMTTVDGTQYYFGLNHLPGWVTGNPTTQSAWTAPVFGNNTGEPCYNATFANASCTQAWRWNLDYIVTPHNTSEAFYYTPETNRYARNGTTAVTYTRGGQLARIDYGTTGGSSLAGQAPARVVFDPADRCIPGSTCDSAHPANWPDTPRDQLCASGACTGLVSPTFFTTKMLAKIHTQVRSGTTYSDVDSWTLAHTFPPPGDTTSPALWLASIAHTGTAADGSTATVPKVVFNGVPMQNRVTVVDGSALQWKYRISSITTETGASIAVTYAPTECTAGNLPTPETNTKRCYPQWWSPTGQNPALDWFHKYVVKLISANPVTGGSQPTDDTYYDYIGTPGWRYETAPGLPDTKRTWSQYAGYSQVRVRHGNDSAPGTQETTTYTYYRGMDGDRLNTGGGTKTATVHASDGTDLTDALWFAGRVRESVTSDGNSGPRSAPVLGPRVANTITTPWASAPTATQGTLTARITADADVVTRTALSAGGDRTTRTITSLDGYGRPTTVRDLGDTATATDNRCTTTSYADNATSWLLAYPSEVNVVAKDCGASLTYPADAISDSRTYYDNSATLGAAPTKGDTTRTDIVKGYTGTTAASAQWLTTATMTYDTLGRVSATTDPRISPARTSHTTYVPTGAGLPTQQTVTNPLGWTTTTDYNVRWGAPTNVTDANSHVTEASYDPLGRRTQVWLPQRPKASNPTPSMSYAYAVSATAPTTVANTKLTPAGTTITSYTLYDGLGRARQTQAPAEGGGRDITDTLYDNAGRVVTQNQLYYTSGTAGGVLFVPATAIPGQVMTGYDGAGRKTYDAQWVNNAEVWRTAHTYGGDHVDITPPSGGTASTTWTDARGNTTELAQYTGGSIPTGPTRNTTYEYDPVGQMTSMTDPGGDTWTWTYDVLGRQTTGHDPDSGDSENTYDDAGRLTSNTDGRNITLAYTYDALDRETGEYVGSLSGTQLTGSTYDTLGKGMLVTSTRYVGGAAFASSTVNAYDAADRVTSAKVVISGGVMAGTYTTVTNYAPDGQISYRGHSAAGGLPGDGASYGYDALGNPASLTGPNAVSYVGATTYSAIGQVSRYTDSIGSETMTRQFTYADGTGRVTRDDTTTNITGNGVAADHSYTYNDAGLITEDQNSVPTVGTDSQCFNYDSLQQLTEAWTPTSSDCATAKSSSALNGPAPYWQSYTYDTIGNRTSVTRHATGGDNSDTYDYPAPGPSTVRPHAVTSVSHTGGGTDSYGYDAAGNTATRPTDQTLSYDSEGHLSAIDIATQGESNIYDADGGLLQRTDPAGTTLYLGDTELHADTDSSTITATRTYSLFGHPVAERTTQAGVTGSNLNWLITDPRGTAEVAINTADSTVTRRHTDPFGNPRDVTAPPWPDSHGYLDAPIDPFAELTHLGAREYDPTLGRFLSVDPILHTGSPQQANGYSYALNNPTSTSDPTGMDPPPVGCQNTACYNCLYSNTNCGQSQQVPPPAAPGKGTVQVSDHVSIDAGVPARAALAAAFTNYWANFNWSRYHTLSPGIRAETEMDQWWNFCETKGASLCGRNLTDSFRGMALSLTDKSPGVAQLVIGEADAAGGLGLGAVTPRYIFRTGSQTDAQLTDKGTGVSFRSSVSSSADGQQTFEPGVKVFAIDVDALPPGSVQFDNTPDGHVSVRGLSADQIRGAIVPHGAINTLETTYVNPLQELGFEPMAAGNGSYKMSK